MIDISMTSFVDFVSATGPSRLTVARNIKRSYEKGYDPRTDYWRPLRKAIAASFASGYDRKALDRELQNVTDPKKLANYHACAAALDSWAKRLSFGPMRNRKKPWTSGELQVAVNPELCWNIGKTQHVIKLYFRADPLSKARSDVALALLQEAFGSGSPSGFSTSAGASFSCQRERSLTCRRCCTVRRLHSSRYGSAYPPHNRKRRMLTGPPCTIVLERGRPGEVSCTGSTTTSGLPGPRSGSSRSKDGALKSLRWWPCRRLCIH